MKSDQNCLWLYYLFLLCKYWEFIGNQQKIFKDNRHFQPLPPGPLMYEEFDAVRNCKDKKVKQISRLNFVPFIPVIFFLLLLMPHWVPIFRFYSSPSSWLKSFAGTPRMLVLYDNLGNLNVDNVIHCLFIVN